uniref:Uncharacterized protein n=1 Tax=Glossina pallidipes TaxID=7398 RepID=A0A1B0ACI8_GLOPL
MVIDLPIEEAVWIKPLLEGLSVELEMQARSHGLPLTDFKLTSVSAPTPTTSFLKCPTPPHKSHHSTPVINDISENSLVIGNNPSSCNASIVDDLMDDNRHPMRGNDPMLSSHSDHLLSTGHLLTECNNSAQSNTLSDYEHHKIYSTEKNVEAVRNTCCPNNPNSLTFMVQNGKDSNYLNHSIQQNNSDNNNKIQYNKIVKSQYYHQQRHRHRRRERQQQNISLSTMPIQHGCDPLLSSSHRTELDAPSPLSHLHDECNVEMGNEVMNGSETVIDPSSNIVNDPLPLIISTSEAMLLSTDSLDIDIANLALPSYRQKIFDRSIYKNGGDEKFSSSLKKDSQDVQCPKAAVTSPSKDAMSRQNSDLFWTVGPIRPSRRKITEDVYSTHDSIFSLTQWIVAIEKIFNNTKGEISKHYPKENVVPRELLTPPRKGSVEILLNRRSTKKITMFFTNIVTSKAFKDSKENYFFAMRPDGVFYIDLETRFGWSTLRRLYSACHTFE